MKYFIANWKANFSLSEANDWVDEFLTFDTSSFVETEIIISAPYHVLSMLKQKSPHLKLASQDVSEYDRGAYTGEIAASMINDLVSFSLIGHSERRSYFHENDIGLAKKSDNCLKYNIEPIYCVRGEDDVIPSQMKFVAYEPVEAIGTGQNQPIEEVLQMKEKLNLTSSTKFIYGGSIDEENIHQYINHPEIDGFLIGGASLNPLHFYHIIMSHLE